jgi:hypothetical protein
MVRLSIDGDNVRVDVLGWSRLWAFKRRLRVPVSHIVTARWDPPAAREWWKGWQLLGTHIPGLIAAGMYYRAGGREFWDVRSGRQAVVIELRGNSYRRLVLDVQDPPAAVRMIAEALRGQAPDAAPTGG